MCGGAVRESGGLVLFDGNAFDDLEVKLFD